MLKLKQWEDYKLWNWMNTPFRIRSRKPKSIQDIKCKLGFHKIRTRMFVGRVQHICTHCGARD